MLKLFLFAQTLAVDAVGALRRREEGQTMAEYGVVLAVTVVWRTDRGERRSREIHHDLAAYRDFPYLEVPDDA